MNTPIAHTKFSQKRSSPHGRAKAWLKLSLSIAILVLLVFGLAPLGLKLPGMKQMSRFAESNGIKVTAIFYTDIEEFAQAEADLRSRLEYGPEIKKYKK